MSAELTPEDGRPPADDATPPVSEVPARRRAGRDLRAAVAVGVVLGTAFLWTTFASPLGFTLLVAALVGLAVFESGDVLSRHGWPVSVPVLLVTGFVTLAGTYQLGPQGQMLGVAVLLIGAVAWELADPGRRDVLKGIAGTVLFGIWVPILASYAVLLIQRPVDGSVAVLSTAGAAIIADIGGFVFGINFGRRKVAPSVSPNKTWEGLIGGTAITVALAVLVLPNIGDLFDVPTAALLGLAGGLAGFTGDLVESMVKRDLGTKDLGTILPGHGGVMDRVDGVLFALPVGYYVLELMGR